MLQFELEWLFSGDRHRFTNDPPAGKLTHDRALLAVYQLLENRTFRLPFARNSIDESLLRPVIERDIAGRRTATEHTDFAHPLRTDTAGGQIGHATIREAQTRVRNVFRFAQHRNA